MLSVALELAKKIRQLSSKREKLKAIAYFEISSALEASWQRFFYAIFVFLAFRDRFGFFRLTLHLYSSILVVCDRCLKTGCHGITLLFLINNAVYLSFDLKEYAS